MPPVMAFHLGSLGFLSPFEFFEYQEKVDDVLQGWLVDWLAVVIIEQVYSPCRHKYTKNKQRAVHKCTKKEEKRQSIRQ